MWLGEDGTTMTVDGVMINTLNDDGLITSIRGHWDGDFILPILAVAFGDRAFSWCCAPG
jgi:hypothetical protein